MLHCYLKVFESQIRDEISLRIEKANYDSFSEPNVCSARLQKELFRAANIFAPAKIESQHFWVLLKLLV